MDTEATGVIWGALERSAPGKWAGMSPHTNQRCVSAALRLWVCGLVEIGYAERSDRGDLFLVSQRVPRPVPLPAPGEARA